jgi:glycine cleavage system transcriptional repressor
VPSLAVTVIGRDRPGIVAEVTAAVSDLGGNLEDSSMTLLRGHFAWMLVAEVSVQAEVLAGRLAHLASDGLTVSVLPVEEEHHAGAEALPFVLSVHGADRPGIVAALTAVLAARGGNITDLSTRLGPGGLYLFVAEVSLPTGVDVPALGVELAQVGHSLGVGVSLLPVESDDL